MVSSLIDWSMNGSSYVAYFCSSLELRSPIQAVNMRRGEGEGRERTPDQEVVSRQDSSDRSEHSPEEICPSLARIRDDMKHVTETSTDIVSHRKIGSCIDQ
jgi:hypothetical protein